MIDMSKIIEISAIDMTLYKFVLPLMRKLSQGGFEIIAAAKDTGYMKKIEDENFRCININFVRNLSPRGNAAAFFALVKLLRRERPTAIHVHTPIASVLARFAALFLRPRPVVFYTLHGLIRQPFFLFVERIACLVTDFIFTVNSSDRKYIVRKKFVSADKVLNLNSVGIDTEKFRPMGKRERFGAEKPTLVFVGRITEEKGITELIEAFKEIRMLYDCRLLIVGPDNLGERDGGLAEELKKQTERYGADVLWLGLCENVADILSEGDIFVLPSYREGMCVSTLEAMSAGLPVVATDIRGIREELTKDCGILVKTKDAAGLARAVEDLLEEPEKAKRMGRNGRKRVVKYFSQKKAVKRQCEVMKRLMWLTS